MERKLKVTWQTFDLLAALHAGPDKACAGKQRFTWPQFATKAAYARECMKRGEIFDVYKCPFCNHYHFGHRMSWFQTKFEIVQDSALENTKEVLTKLSHYVRIVA